MSYDLHMLRADAVGDDPTAAYERLQESEARARTPEERARLRRLVSYGADEPRVRAAIDEVRRYLPVFERHGYVAYDPQLERLFDVTRDAADAIRVYREARGAIDGEPQAPAADGRPWWKKLFG